MISRSYVVNLFFNTLKVSDDKGLSWQTLTPSPFPDISVGPFLYIVPNPFNGYEAILCVSSGSGAGVWKTSDGGNSFSQIVSGSGGFYTAYYLSGSVIVAVGNEIHRSIDGGDTFTPTSYTAVGLYGSTGLNIIAKNVTFNVYSIGFLSIFDKLYKSYDAGLNWVPVNGNLPISTSKIIYGVRHLNDTNLVSVAVETDGIYLSNDGGFSFTLDQAIALSGISNTLFSSRIDTKAWLFCATGDIYYSPTSAAPWSIINTYPYVSTYSGIFAFSNGTDLILTGAGSGGGAETSIFTSNDNGTTLNPEDNYPGRSFNVSSTLDYECGECPNKSIFNPETGQCELLTDGGPICPPGYTYDPITGQCVGVSTFYPKDIIISRDNSGSITGSTVSGPFCDLAPSTQTEWNQMTLMQDDIITGISAEITLGNIQVGVVDWSTSGILTQPLTSVLGDVQSAVCAQRTSSGGTNTVAGLCTAYNELKFGATQVPTAEKVIILFTDGIGGFGSCVVNGVLYNVGSISQLRQLATAIKNDGVKIILVALGENASDIAGIENNYVNVADPVPSLDSNGDLLYFDATFDTAGDIVAGIIDGLSTNEYIPAPQCPDDCTIYVNPVTGDAYCRCIEVYPIVPCCYELIDCNGIEDNIYTFTNLLEYFDESNVIKIEGFDTCWTINKLDSFCENTIDVIVSEVYVDCPSCNPSYTLYNCNDLNEIIYTNVDLSNLLGKTVKLLGLPNECWQIGPDTDKTGPYQIALIDSQFESCSECKPKDYQLTNCLNNEAVVITNTDLSNYLNKVITVNGIPGICFSVTDVQCDCIRVTINSLTDYVVQTLGILNGKNYYQVDLDLITITIAWDEEDNRWEVIDSSTGVVYAYTLLTTECPFTEYWIITDDSPFYLTNISISYCVNQITDIEPINSFIDCDCCIKC